MIEKSDPGVGQYVAWSRTARRHQDFFTDELAMKYFVDTFGFLANRVGSAIGLALHPPIAVRETRENITLTPAAPERRSNHSHTVMYSLFVFGTRPARFSPKGHTNLHR